MSLAAGTRLGPYEVLGPIGAGGMGEVYRARDTRLERSVAIKILPADLASDHERRARFEREARTISTLNHPHICTLHDIGDHDGTPYLVMEHLAGVTLAERLKKGAIPLPQALEIGAQIADALDAAHKHGIIHRDLKPGNVMLATTGATHAGAPHVKLLDFGLAKLTGHGERPALITEASAPTEAECLTGRGTILGTLPYMAPEQLEGQPADARTDLWALGAILYEMLTGTRAFQRESSVSLISAIMQADPPALTALHPLTPPALERVVRKCLAKHPGDRWDGAHDVADELRWIRETSRATTPSGLAVAGAPVPGRSRRRLWAVGGAGALLCVVVGAVLVWALRPAAPAEGQAVVQSLVVVSPADEVNAGGFSPIWIPTPGGSRPALTWTPDGRALVFVGRRAGVQHLYVRALHQAEARRLERTEGAQVPVVSPDGQWVAFWAAGAIRKVPLAGGPTSAMVEPVSRVPMGLDWGLGGLLYDGQGDGPIWRGASDQAPRAVTALHDGENLHVLPRWLPGGRVFLYTARAREWTWGDERVIAHDLATGTRTVVLQRAVDARYLSSGHLVFMRLGTLFAVPFDAETLETHGDPVALLSGVAHALSAGNASDTTGAGQFSVAATGHLAYLPGDVVPYRDYRLVTLTRDGRVTPLPSPVRSYAPTIGVSPNGGSVAVPIRTVMDSSLWLFDVSRSLLTKVTTEGEVSWPRWTPDGQRVAFSRLHEGKHQLVWQPTDGTGPAVALVDGLVTPGSWRPDGQELVAVRARENRADIVAFPIRDGAQQERPLVATPAAEGWPAISPDGRWLAYASDTSGRFEAYLQPYPGPGARVQVSVEGGSTPAWHPSGRQLFFVAPSVSPDTMWMTVVDVDLRGDPRLGTPRRLFEFRPAELGFQCGPSRCYDVAPDGQRFYVVQSIQTPPSPPVTQIHIVLNWTEELKAKVPTR